VTTFDMKQFTHGVWRGLREAGRHTVYWLEEAETTPLATFLRERLAADHELVRVPPPDCAPSVVPLAQYVVMTRLWARLCERYAASRPGWSPLFLPKGEFSGYRGINDGFDIASIGASDVQ